MINKAIASFNSVPPLKLAAIILAASILLNGAFIYLVVLPLNKKIETVKSSTDELIASNERKRGIISKTTETRERVASLSAEYEKTVGQGVLKPLLNSYAMRAKTLLSPYMELSGLTIENVTEKPPIPLQQPQPVSDKVFYRQPVEITTSGSYTQMTALISYVEKDLPMSVLSYLKITPQNRDPEIHKIILTFEWPAETEIAH